MSATYYTTLFPFPTINVGSCQGAQPLELSFQLHWHSQLENGVEVQAIFFDLQKAFDSLPHRPLLDKLHNLKIPLHLISCISSYITL